MIYQQTAAISKVEANHLENKYAREYTFLLSTMRGTLYMIRMIHQILALSSTYLHTDIKFGIIIAFVSRINYFDKYKKAYQSS